MGGVAVTGRTGDPQETDADTRVIPVFDEEPLDDASLQQLVDSGEAKSGLRRLAVTHEHAARALQNTPSNDATPACLAERARELADAHDKLEFEAWDRERITEAGMNAFAGVARGSYEEPRLIVLRYEGADSGPVLGYVGKAVTFDTGGISIKPSAKMHEMKFDMSGGAAVIEAIGAIAELGLPVRILGVVPATENMPSG